MRLFRLPLLLTLLALGLPAAPGRAAEASQYVQLVDGVYRTDLSNGVPVYLYPLAGPPIAEIQLWVRAGSRHDPPEMRGASHLLEHLFYRATATRGDFEGRRAILATGGESEGRTWYDWQYHRAKVPTADLAIPIAVFCDALQHLALTDEAIALEQRIVLREIAERNADPETLIWNATMAAAYGSGPYAEPVMGTPETVLACTPEAIRDLYEARFGTNHIAFVVTGVFEAEAVVAQLESQLTGLRTGDEPEVLEPIGRELRAPKVGTIRCPGKEAEVRISYRVPGTASPGGSACHLIAALLSEQLRDPALPSWNQAVAEYRAQSEGGLLIVRQRIHTIAVELAVQLNTLTRDIDAYFAEPLDAARLLRSSVPVPATTSDAARHIGRSWAEQGGMAVSSRARWLSRDVLFGEVFQPNRATLLIVNPHDPLPPFEPPALPSLALESELDELWMPAYIEDPVDPLIGAPLSLAGPDEMAEIHSLPAGRSLVLLPVSRPVALEADLFFDVGSDHARNPIELGAVCYAFQEILRQSHPEALIEWKRGHSNSVLRTQARDATSLSAVITTLGNLWQDSSTDEVSRDLPSPRPEDIRAPVQPRVQALWESIYGIEPPDAEPDLAPDYTELRQTGEEFRRHLRAIVIAGPPPEVATVLTALDPWLPVFAKSDAGPDRRFQPIQVAGEEGSLAKIPLPDTVWQERLFYAARHPEFGMGGADWAAGFLLARALEWRLVGELVYRQALCYTVRVERLSIGAPGALAIVVEADPAGHNAIRAALDALLADFAATEFTAEDLAALQTWARGYLLLQSESAEATSHQIGMALVHDRPWNAFIDASVLLDSVTLADLNALREELTAL